MGFPSDDLRLNKYFAVHCSVASHVLASANLRGYLKPLPWGFLEFSKSKSLSMVLMNMTVALLPLNSHCFRTMFTKSIVSATEHLGH